MKTLACISLIAIATFSFACSDSHPKDYLHNQATYDNIMCNPVYVEEVTGHGENTVHLSYDSKHRCIGWEKDGGSYDNVETTIEYDGNSIAKIHSRYSFPGDDIQRTEVVVFNASDSTVIYCPEDMTNTIIVGAKLKVTDKEGKIIGESDLDNKGRVLSLKDSLYDRKFTLTKNGDVASVKAIDLKSGEEFKWERVYLQFDKKGNWTKAVDISDNQADTVRRIICYSDMDVERLFADKKRNNKQTAEDYLDLKYSDFAPWTVNEAGLIDSLATPFMELMSLSIQYAQLSLAIVKANTMKEVNDISEEERYLYKILLESASICNNPEDHDKNRLGFKVSARRANSNTDETIYFFLNNDLDKTVGHCSLDLKKRITEIEESRNKFMVYKQETISYLR